MSQWIIASLILVGVGLLIGLMARSWRARGRRQSDIPAPDLATDDLSDPFVAVDALYVATSRGGDPLDRVVVHGLGFRGRAIVSVHAEGVRLEIAGEPAVLIRTSSLRGVDRATWTIDRVVERDGLVLVGWRLGDVDLDTYLRITDDPSPVVAAIRPLVPTAPGAGTTKEKTID
ncbi:MULTISPECIES: hypothetical protein [unclassified Frigoribacterium]|jgi:hypothetical protein|uniref:PH-like domain-containing protein n=1 Tax=unclassified Frigoribacterium TaxID=2627005 RepID=UPI0006FD6948|nr:MULTISPECIES: hypothetical protein [unclassified Frigoribacterium]KQN45881.1 hypothetical protein ASE87_05060 [Frigoribacterium sp. Leaf44]MBD8539346.1 hypothetical protein [Frigoribacterium sp. CFBP 8751]